MAEESRLGVLGGQPVPERRVVEQVDLPDRQKVGGAPVGVERRTSSSRGPFA
jgi:hypothetical protein